MKTFTKLLLSVLFLTLATPPVAAITVSCNSVSSCLALAPICGYCHFLTIGTTCCDQTCNSQRHRLVIRCEDAEVGPTSYPVYDVEWYGQCELNSDPVPNFSTWSTSLKPTYQSIQDCDCHTNPDPPEASVPPESMTIAFGLRGGKRLLLSEHGPALAAYSDGTEATRWWSWAEFVDDLAAAGMVAVDDAAAWPAGTEPPSAERFSLTGPVALFKLGKKTLAMSQADVAGVRRPAFGVVTDGGDVDWSAGAVGAVLAEFFNRR